VNEPIPEGQEDHPPVSDAGDPSQVPEAGQDPAAADGNGPGASDDRRSAKYYPL
jgi:hypothetical protein